MNYINLFILCLVINIYQSTKPEDIKPEVAIEKKGTDNGQEKDKTLNPEQTNEEVGEFLLTEENFHEEDLVKEDKPKECYEELVSEYRLYPFNETGEEQQNYLCPYVTQDCCAFSSQKIIQLLWGRVSKPRLQRVLTRNLHYIEKIINYTKSLIQFYQENNLPDTEKYSAECLTSMDDMNQFVDDDLNVTLDKQFEDIKERFDRLYRFKKQFYCTICDSNQHQYFDLFDKKLQFSELFCETFQLDFKDTSWFLNVELVEIFKSVRNYVLCYKEKSFLMMNDLYKFKKDRILVNDLERCREKQECLDFCNRYEFSTLSEVFIGKQEWLEQMHDFLDQNQVDNRGFFKKEHDMEKIAEEGPNQEQHDFLEEEKEKQQSQGHLETVMWDFFKNSFDIQRQRIVKRKMRAIKDKVEKEFSQKNVHQLFITINDSKIDLDEFHLNLESTGLNPYELLDREDLYKVNANLTFFQDEISNAVPELLDLNETDIIKKLVNVSKLISEDGKNKTDFEQYIEAKVFGDQKESKYFMIENPYIDTQKIRKEKEQQLKTFSEKKMLENKEKKVKQNAVASAPMKLISLLLFLTYFSF